MFFQFPQKTLLANAFRFLMKKKIGALMVLDTNGAIQGIISERDILRKTLEKKGAIFDIPVKDAMTPKDRLIFALKNDDIGKIMDAMTKYKIRHLPVVHDNKLIGIVSIGDIVKFLLENAQIENEALKNYISGKC